MYPCVVCGRQQSVIYRSKSSRGFNQLFGKKIGELLVTRVKKHKFWGVNINIMEDKKVEIETKYIYFWKK